MTSEEKQKIYKADRKDYILENNETFLLWLQANLASGYTPALDIEEMQDFIKTIVSWYEFRYPLRNYTFNELGNGRFEEDDLSREMSFEELRNRINYSLKNFLDAKYRMGSGYNSKDKLVNISIKDTCTRGEYRVNIDEETGLVKGGDLDFLDLYSDTDEPLTIVELYNTLKDLIERGKEEMDITILRRVYMHHKIDLKLRRMLFDLIVKALIYSKNSPLELGFDRAVIFSGDVYNRYGIALNIPDLSSLPKEKEKKSITDTIKIIELKRRIANETAKRFQ